MRRSALFVAFLVTSSSLVGEFCFRTPGSRRGRLARRLRRGALQGQSVKFTGQLDNPPGAETQVDLQLGSGQVWTDIRQVTTTDGTYEFDLGTASTNPRTFRASVKGQGIESNEVTINAKSYETVTPLVKKPKATPSDPFVGATFHLTGDLGVKQARTVILQRDSGSSWADHPGPGLHGRR